MPRVSVILTSYNHAKYIRQAIESVLNQSFQDFELLICDDASTDGSVEIIREYKDPRIKQFFREKNARGMLADVLENKLPSGELIAIHHSDDVWEPKKLEVQVKFLDANPVCGAVFSDATPISENGSELDDKSNFYYSVFTQPNRSRQQWLRYFFFNGNCLCHPSVLIRKECCEECGVYKLGLAQSADYDMWINLCSKFEIHVLPEKLVRFRVRDNEANESGGRPEAIIRWASEFYFSRKSFLQLSKEDLFGVFPELKGLNRGANTVKEYVLSRACLLPETHKQTKLFGLNLLAMLVEKVDFRRELKELYDFDYNEFTKLSGNEDIFTVLPGENVSIYFDEGSGIVEANTISLKRTSTQYFKSQVLIPRGCKKIMVIPAKRYMALTSYSFIGVTPDGKCVELNHSFPDFRLVNGSLIFNTDLPQIDIDIPADSNLTHLNIEWSEGNVHGALLSLVNEVEVNFRGWLKMRFPILRKVYRVLTLQTSPRSVLRKIKGKILDKFSKTKCPLCLSVDGYDPLPSEYKELSQKYGYKYFGQGEMTSLDTYSCKKCGASDRERLYAVWIDEQIKAGIFSKKSRVLHFAPEISLRKMLLNKGFDVYHTCDLMTGGVDFKEDIMALSFADESYDFIICSHVLEHVYDDRKALNEMYRVLRPGGMAILMAPICLALNKSDEGPDEQSPSERWRRFGQDDHVRLYSGPDFVQRVEAAGFALSLLDSKYFTPRVFQTLGLKKTSKLYVGIK